MAAVFLAVMLIVKLGPDATGQALLSKKVNSVAEVFVTSPALIPFQGTGQTSSGGIPFQGTGQISNGVCPPIHSSDLSPYDLCLTCPRMTCGRIFLRNRRAERFVVMAQRPCGVYRNL
jgi:hypothetical protein